MEGRKFWISSGIITMGDKLTALFLGFGSFLMLVRILPEEDFGIWALFLTVTTLIEQARNGLIQNAYIKFLNANQTLDEKKKVTTASFVLNLQLTFVSVFFLITISPFLASYWHSPEMVEMLRFYSLTTVSLVFLSQFNFLQQANLDFKGIFFSNVFRQSVFFSFVSFMFLTAQKPDLVLMVNIQTLGAVLGTIVTYFFAKKYLFWSKEIDWKMCRSLFSYGKFVFGTNISATIFKTTDQILMGNLLGKASVGAYNAAARVSNLFEVPITSIASIVFPHSTKKISENGLGEVKEIYENSVAVMVALILPAIFIVFAFPTLILKYLAGEKYVFMGLILQLIVLQNLFLPFLRQFGTLLDAIGKPNLNFYTLLANVALNLLVNYIMIQWLGMKGAALGTLIVFFLFASFNIWYMNKNFDVSLWTILTKVPKLYKDFLRIIIKKVKR